MYVFECFELKSFWQKTVDGMRGDEISGVNERTRLIRDQSERNDLEKEDGDKRLSKYFLIPQRYVVGLMGFFAVVNAYTMRTTLNVAITEMVMPIKDKEHHHHDSCSSPITNFTNTVTDTERLYDWDEKTQGLILSSFYWGYVLTHLPGGILAEKFGGKYSLGLGILSTALFTLLTPLIVVYGYGNWKWLVGLRILEGLGEGTTFPALNAILAKWVPVSERAKIGSLVYAGGIIGTVIGTAISGALIEATEDWASCFYLFGSLGVLWFVIWTLICYSDPESHPFISDKEKKFLEKELVNVSNEKKDIPWTAILTSMPVWALVVAQIGHDWGFFTMATDLPKYMKDVLKFNVKENGLWSSLPYVVMWLISISSGWFCDWLIQKNYMSISFARKFFTTIASVGPGVFLIAASYSGCNRMLAVSMFTVAMGIMGTYYCGMKVNALDLSPNFAGTLMAIVNGIGAVSGIITPYLIGALTDEHTVHQWRLVFWIAFIVFIVTNVFYLLFASGDEQWWNIPNATKTDLEKGHLEKSQTSTSKS